jgi:hypothetical protein
VEVRAELTAEQIRALDLLAEFQGRTREDVLRDAIDYYFATDPEPDEQPTVVTR